MKRERKATRKHVSAMKPSANRVSSQASASGVAAGADAGAGPSLRDLLGASSELNANDDPGLEDPLEFFMVSFIIMQSKLNY